jgi:hypothetical protein
MLRPFYTLFFSSPTALQMVRRCLAPVLLLVASGFAGQAWATNYTVANPNKNSTFTLATGDQITINSNVSFGGAITVQGNGVTIINNGNIAAGGSITVNSGTTGTVINNLGTVPSQQVFLNAATTVNNGSTTVTNATWAGYVGGNFTAPLTINNFGSWTAQIQPLPGGTITNNSGATWNAYMTVSAPVTVVNNGTWSSQIQPAGNPTFTITNTGTWTGPLSANGYTTAITNSGNWSGQIDYSGTLAITHTAGTWTGLPNGNSGRLTVVNGGTWTKGGFNFPSNGPNSFVTQAGGTTSFDANVGLNAVTSFENSGTLSLNRSSSLPTGATITNNASAVLNLPLGDGNTPSAFINAGTITNAGTINATSGAFANTGTLANSHTLAVTGNFSNSGAVTGPGAPLRGSITATGTTSNTGTFGVVGRLDFCDATAPTPASNGFDTRGGTIGAATTYCSGRPLPVELTSFTATAAQGQVQVRWRTASEHNSQRFVVERSANGEDYVAVTTVAGQGSTAQATAYAVTDAKPLAGTSYYRLRQIDHDGSATYSLVAAVHNAAEHPQFTLYPNPATDHLLVDLTSAAEPCKVRLLGLSGNVWLELALQGGSQQQVPLAGLPAGLYLLQVRTAQGSTVQRVQKQ